MSRQFHVPIILPADPTAALEAVTKQYVDVGGMRVGCALNHSVSINTGQSLTIPYGTESWDTHNFHATNATDIIIPTGLDGTYGITVEVDAGGTLNGLSNCQITVGSTIFPFYIPAQNRYGAGSVILYCSAGAVIRGITYNGHSGAATFINRIWVSRLGG